MTVPTWRDWTFAINLALAGLLAMFAALWIDLPRPYWAMSTVIITSQPLAGATRAKAIYRVYGTLLGAVAAVIMVPNLVDEPELLTLAIALWVGFCLYFSLLDRSAKSYVLMLAGYTAAFIGFPDVGAPGTIFDVAVARAEEITLGILCASLVNSLLLPQSALPAVSAKLDQWFQEARHWSVAILGREQSSGGQIKRLQLAAGAIGFDALCTPLRYDAAGGPHAAEALNTLRQHMLMYLPIIHSIEDRVGALEQMQALNGKVRDDLDALAAWVASGTTDPAEADRLRSLVAEADLRLGDRPGWTDLLTVSLVTRMRDFIDLRQDSRTLQRHIATATPATEPLAFQYTAKARSIRHHDAGMAFLSAFAAVIAILLGSAIWIATAWPEGSAAPMMAAVGCSLFALQDDPAVMIMDFAKAALIGAVGATFYLFVLLPKAAGAETLIIAFAPAFLIVGLLMTQPRTAIIGLGTGVVGFTLLALQNNYSGDFAAFANSTLAVVVGVWLAAIVTRLLRSVGAGWSARRLQRINRAGLVTAATGHGERDGLRSEERRVGKECRP